MVWLFITQLSIPSFDSPSAATRALYRSIPHPIIATSGFISPAGFQKQAALPISNGVALVVKTGDFSLPILKYDGLPLDAIATVAFCASTTSHGTTTVIFGCTHIKAISSSAW